MNYRTRLIEKIFKKKLQYIGGVLLEGPKWCGKTTTSIQLSKSVLNVADPDKLQSNIDMATISPSVLLEGETPRLIDEWQIAPQLWDCARHEIDRRSRPGQFIFTGSSTPPERDKILHSGTGRFARIKMRPMSLFESGDSNGKISLREIFNGAFKAVQNNKIDINDLAFLICRGGWPQVIDIKKDLALSFTYDYYDGLIHSDINRADNINKNPERVNRLMRSFARNLGAQTPYTTLKKDLIKNDVASLDENTIMQYINALKNIFIIEDMPAWNPNLRSKVAIRTSDNRYFVDPSIGTAALGIGPKDLIDDLSTMGLMYETLCVRDLRVYAQALDGNVYHYRDSKDLECDCVVHLRNGKYGLIEIKLGGSKLIEEGATTLKKLYSKLDISKMKEPSFMMVLTGIGDYAYKREDGIIVVPITCLKD